MRVFKPLVPTQRERQRETEREEREERESRFENLSYSRPNSHQFPFVTVSNEFQFTFTIADSGSM